MEKRSCKKCGNKVIKSHVEGYAYRCEKCDKDLYIFETELVENEQYQCSVCGKYIDEDKGITTLNGWWVCDEDTCRTLDEEENSIEKTGINTINIDSQKEIEFYCNRTNQWLPCLINDLHMRYKFRFYDIDNTLIELTAISDPYLDNNQWKINIEI